MPNKREFLENYYAWLISLIGGDLPPYDEYTLLLKSLYFHKYVWQEWNLSVVKDSNRALDGIGLRSAYVDAYFGGNPYFLAVFNEKGCSILEMMIALARHMEFDMTMAVSDNSVKKWFWLMVQNLGLIQYDDDHYNTSGVNVILHKFLTRGYDNHGAGGMFYIRKPPTSCRETELYYQMEWWLNENFKI